ncbi:MAG: cyclic nucleotide-binding domain-containing protein [Alphaproteobacteria bacterium]|nr:cyclic nucleotide-binding domain-containing protein [Alphaproteobacteria bacterium]
MAQQPVNKKTFPPSHVIFKEGDIGDQAYLVQKGLIEIVQRRGDGDKVIRRVGAGEIFGAMAAIDTQARVASVGAVEESICVVISRQLLEQKISASDPLIVALLRWFTSQARGKAVH